MRGQRGVSYWGVVAILVIAFFGIQFSIAVGGAYMDNYTINKIVVQRLKEVSPNTDPSTFMASVGQQFQMSGLRGVNVSDRLSTVNSDGLQVTENYEIRSKFMGNIDLVVHFEKKFDQKAIQAAG